MKLRVGMWCVLVVAIIAVDQWIKWLMIDGFFWESVALSLGGRALVYNDGVAFSMFAFLQDWLKWIQIALLIALLAYMTLAKNTFKQYWVALGFIIGGGVANVCDRFIHGAVVDYVYWHYWFDFAIFNFADVCIDIGVVILLIQWLYYEKKAKPHNPHSA